MNPIHTALSSLYLPKPFRARRVSSFDPTGGNDDWRSIQPGDTLTVADIQGPGIISHLWFTVNSPDKHYLRKLVLRIFWDEEASPSVEAPLGDFFGLGHARTFSYQCALFNTSAFTDGALGGGCAMNAWVPMPFRKRARIEVVNEQSEPVNSLYFYVDYQQHASLPEDVLYFHAHWRRELPCDGWKGPGSVSATPEWFRRMEGPEGKNLSDAGNYRILEARGRGHFIGVNFSIDHLAKGWYGEGDDMIFVDDEPWPPSLHGTGTEDYLGHAWGMQKNAHLYNGQSWAELETDWNLWGKVCVYRYHLLDPIPFTRSIRVSIEHGHANERSDDYCSTAYWYQSEPHVAFAPLLPADARLPHYSGLIPQ
jgi:hypothetical protein